MWSDEAKKGSGAAKLHRAGEDYLKTILALQIAYGGVHSADVAKELNVSKASVCNAIKRLRADGFLTMAPNKLLRLTDQGREAAEQMLERHAILKRCLVVMGVDPDTAQEDACRMEHAVSPETVERMRRFVLQVND